MPPSRVLLADDQATFRKGLADRASPEREAVVKEAVPDTVLVDGRSPAYDCARVTTPLCMVIALSHEDIAFPLQVRTARLRRIMARGTGRPGEGRGS